MIYAAFLLLQAFAFYGCAFFGVQGTPPNIEYVALGCGASAVLVAAMHMWVKGARVN